MKPGVRGYRALDCSFVVIRARPASAGIGCGCVSVCPSVTSRCSTEADKRRIMQTTPHDSPGTLVFWRWKSRQNSNRVTPNGSAKCRCDSWKLATFDAKRCQLSSVTSLSHWTSAWFVCSIFAVMQRVAWICQRQLILVTQWKSVSDEQTDGMNHYRALYRVVHENKATVFDCLYHQNAWTNLLILGILQLRFVQNTSFNSVDQICNREWRHLAIKSTTRFFAS